MAERYECDQCGACCRHLIIEIAHVDVVREPKLVPVAVSAGDEQCQLCRSLAGLPPLLPVAASSHDAAPPVAQAAAGLRRFHVRPVPRADQFRLHRRRFWGDGAGPGAHLYRAHEAPAARATVFRLAGARRGAVNHRAALRYVRAPWPLPHVQLGVSVGDQETANLRIPLLLRCPAAVRIVSYEPALGPVDFTQIEDQANGRIIDALAAPFFLPRSGATIAEAA